MNPTFFHLGTSKIAATQAASSATLIGDVGTNVVIYNAGPDLAFVKIGPSGTTATVPTTAGSGGMPVPVGFYGFTVARSQSTDNTVSAICATGQTATLYFSVGSGN